MSGYSEDKIRESALRILDYGDCSAFELKRKLTGKGFSAEDIDPVIAALIESGLLNDGRFAENYARSALERGKGPAWIRSKLAGKGIDGQVISLALEETGAAETEQAAGMKKALSLCGLKEWFSVDIDGRPVPSGSADPDEIPDPFGRRIPDSADRREIRALREKEKARLARRLAGAGFSQSTVYAVIRELDNLKK